MTIAIAVITAIVAGALSIGLIVTAESSSARRTLARIADSTETASAVGNVQVGETRARQLLRVLGVQYVTLDAAGNVLAGTAALARDAVRPGDAARLVAGQKISALRTVDGHPLFFEARPTRSGGIVVVQRRSDALPLVLASVVRRVLLAIAIAVAIATALSLLVASRLARPLRRTAQAAHALASGRRDVAVTPEGPAEVAEVGAAVSTLAEHLAYSEARQREFLMSVSHELRTPLTAITGYAESLAGGVIPSADIARVGQVMLGEAHRLDRLVADLLDLARLDAADFRMDFVATDLNQLASATADVWANRCAAAGVRFVLDVQSSPVTSWTDPARLRQAVDGLLENALRVAPAGAPIVLAVRREAPASVVIEVRDGGPGLNDTDLSVAFDRSALFERYRGVRQVGTGLGLAIVHGLVSRLGGTVEAGHALEGGA
ncbi:MAG: HAMP domain-containing histidine kinase, partial [Actinomycetota bacterium]|nr:HAMP domain-containing histidine kinase [Actinomycetota bacterium]